MSAATDTFSFLKIYHAKRNPRISAAEDDQDFLMAEKFFLNTFEIGLFEAFEFMYQHCKSANHLEEWLIELKGIDFYKEKSSVFNDWCKHINVQQQQNSIIQILDEQQLLFWKKNGYLQLSGFVPNEDCDTVVALICKTLDIDLNDPTTWYPQHKSLHGLMLQLYQGAEIEKIRKNTTLFQVFAQLYQTNKIIANCEKVSYNPPETNNFSFMGSALHWDIDFNIGPRYYIQGLIYLNDVPVNRGAFSLIPGFQHQIDKILVGKTPEEALALLKDTETVTYLDGKKGDLIIWLESLPHAATPNKSDLPRFVQYASFIKVE